MLQLDFEDWRTYVPFEFKEKTYFGKSFFLKSSRLLLFSFYLRGVPLQKKRCFSFYYIWHQASFKINYDLVNTKLTLIAILFS